MDLKSFGKMIIMVEEDEYKINQEAFEEFMERTYGTKASKLNITIDKELWELAMFKSKVDKWMSTIYAQRVECNLRRTTSWDVFLFLYGDPEPINELFSITLRRDNK